MSPLPRAPKSSGYFSASGGPAPGKQDLAPNTLLYVEKDMILPIAAKLVGGAVTSGAIDEARVGFNWFAAASAGHSEEYAAEVKMSELFPEDVFHYVYPFIRHRRLKINEFCGMAEGRDVVPPEVVTVNGVLRIPGVTPDKSYTPFDPPDLDQPKIYRVYGYRTFVAELDSGDGFSIPLYVFADAVDLVYYAINKPVEVVGVLKWSPTFEVGGHMVNCILLCAALLLSR